MVAEAKSPHSIGPKRVSLPSQLPPAWLAVTVWETPTAVSFGLPRASIGMMIRVVSRKRNIMAAKTTQPCFLSPASLPNV